jgi:hypothetical protein
MGDRVVILFTDEQRELTPGIYMHWQGKNAPQMIRDGQSLMRKDDATYAAARFCGFCHEATGRRTTGLGLLAPPAGKDDVIDWDDYSHGDAGVYVVNVSDGTVEHHGGDGKGFKLDPAKFGD